MVKSARDVAYMDFFYDDIDSNQVLFAVFQAL